MPTFERASAEDIPALSQLLSTLFSQEAEFKPDDAAQRQGLAAIIANPALGAILVARDGADILAMVNLLFTMSTALGARVALLEDMVAAPGVRGTGIGSALLSHALEFAAAQGIKRITLLTDQDNHVAQRFYARHGFARSSMVPLRLALDGH